VDEYSATLAKWFGVSPTYMDDVFPNLGRFPALAALALGELLLALWLVVRGLRPRVR